MQATSLRVCLIREALGIYLSRGFSLFRRLIVSLVLRCDACPLLRWIVQRREYFGVGRFSAKVTPVRGSFDLCEVIEKFFVVVLRNRVGRAILRLF